MFKKFSILLMSVAMMTNLLPTQFVSAETSINIGDYIEMGTYYGKPILWRCVDIDENGPLMLSDRILCIKAFDASGDDTSGSHGRGYDSGYYRKQWGSNYWADSNIRCWLNSSASAGNVVWACGNPPDSSHMYYGYNAYNNEAGFLTNFSSSELACIKTVTQDSLLDQYEYSNMKPYGSTYLSYNYNISNVVQNAKTTAYRESVTDSVFLLDVNQINKVYQNDSLLGGNNYYIGIPTAEAVENSEYKDSGLTSTDRWRSWLRSPYAGYNYYCNIVRDVYPDGRVTFGAAGSEYRGVRPAFYLNLSSYIQYIYRNNDTKRICSVVAYKNGAEVAVDDAIVTVYDGTTALTDKDVTITNIGNGKYLFDWHRKVPENATISAYKTISSGSAINGNDRDELFKNFGYTNNGDIERYVLELHSETLDVDGNWCGVKYKDLMNDSCRLVLKEPRMKVNLSVCYYLPYGTSDYYNDVKETMEMVSKELAQSTDGHLYLNKVYIFNTGERNDFYNTKKLASMADVRIETADASTNGAAIHSNANTGGFYDSNKSIIFDSRVVENIPKEYYNKMKRKKTFSRIQMGVRRHEEAGTKTTIFNNKNYYAKAMAHEIGHYVMNFYDEYELCNSDKTQTKTQTRELFRNTPYQKAFSEGIGLMDNQNGNIELSSVESYSYTMFDGIADKSDEDKYTVQFYNNRLSCESQLSAMLSGKMNSLISTNGYDVSYSLKGFELQHFWKIGYQVNDDYDYTNRSSDITESGVYVIEEKDIVVPKYRKASYGYAGYINVISGSSNLNSFELSSDSTCVETLTEEIDTDGYYFISDNNRIECYIIPNETDEFTFNQYNELYENGDYKSVNQGIEIIGANNVNASGEIYSVADINEDIDYSTVSWFVFQNGEWKKLDTRYSKEENDNIGAACDYIGSGLYVLMAEETKTDVMTPVTNIIANNDAFYDHNAQITFNDENDNTAYYKIYCSSEEFDSVSDEIDCKVFPKNTNNLYVVNISDTESDFYCGVVAVSENGSTSELSNVENITVPVTDTDNDGIPDYWCDEYMLWDLDDIAGSDVDGDGLTNADEFTNNTNPLLCDTDEDCVYDGTEIDLNLNPLTKKTDGVTPDAYIAYGEIDVSVEDIMIQHNSVDSETEVDTFTCNVTNNSDVDLKLLPMMLYADDELIYKFSIDLNSNAKEQIEQVFYDNEKIKNSNELLLVIDEEELFNNSSAAKSAELTLMDSVILNKTVLTLEIGNSDTLTATITPDYAINKNIIWTSSDSNIVTVENGVLVAVASGSATITATTELGQKTATCVVTVPVSQVSGDINGDNKLNNKDATQILRYFAGWSQPNLIVEALDVNGDGRINNRDATHILRYLAGWEVELY